MKVSQAIHATFSKTYFLDVILLWQRVINNTVKRSGNQSFLRRDLLIVHFFSVPQKRRYFCHF